MWEKFLHTLSKPEAVVFIFLVPASLLGLLFWRRLPRAFRLLTLYLCFDVLVETGLRVMSVLFNNNLPLIHVYTLGSLLVWSFFYREILPAGSFFNRYFNWIVGLVSGAVILNTLFVQHLFTFNSYAITLVQILIILYALDYAFNFAEQEEKNGSTRQPLRRVNAGVLLYFSGSLFVFMFSPLALQYWNDYKVLWHVNNALNVLFHLIVLISLCQVIFKPAK